MIRGVMTGVLMILVLGLFAQDDKPDADKMFMHARELAFSGKRKEARKLCRQILAAHPAYYDVRILMGRTYAWDHNYDSARVALDAVLRERPAYKDALSARLDVAVWSHDEEEALAISSKALYHYPTDEDFLLKRARIMVQREDYDEAQTLLYKLLEINPTNEAAYALLESLAIKRRSSAAGMRYEYQSFSKVFSPAHYSWLELKQKMRGGSLIARVNAAHRFGVYGYQIETDYYPTIRKGTYAYLNAGVSLTKLFPRFRAGAEIYQKLPWSMEASAGFRYLVFYSVYQKDGVDRDTVKQVMIYTGSLGKYWKNWWFSFRPYITPKGIGTSFTALIYARRYFHSAENYFTLEAGRGFSPDLASQYGNYSPDVKVLNAWRAGIDGQYSIKKRWLIQCGLRYENEEYLFGGNATVINVITYFGGVKYIF